jgi:hypothetical protein
MKPFTTYTVASKGAEISKIHVMDILPELLEGCTPLFEARETASQYAEVRILRHTITMETVEVDNAGRKKK